MIHVYQARFVQAAIVKELLRLVWASIRTTIKWRSKQARSACVKYMNHLKSLRLAFFRSISFVHPLLWGGKNEEKNGAAGEDVLLTPARAAGDLVTKGWYAWNFRTIRELVEAPG